MKKILILVSFGLCLKIPFLMASEKVILKADVTRLSGGDVTVIGTYHRLSLPLSARPDAQLKPTQKAEITLADGTHIFLYPLWDKRSNRSEVELKKYEGQKVRILGKILSEQGNDPNYPQASRIVGPCFVPHSDPWWENPIPLIRNKSDLQKYIGKKVTLIGRYQSEAPYSPDFSSMGDMDGIQKKPTYRRADVALADGTMVSLFDPLNKESLRSPKEHTKFSSKEVEVTGIVGMTQDSPLFITPENWPPALPE